MSVQYTGGCSVHWGISLSAQGVFSTLGDIIEYTGVFSTLGNIMNTQGVFSTLRGIMMSVVDIMSTLGDVQYTGVSIQIQLFSQ